MFFVGFLSCREPICQAIASPLIRGMKQQEMNPPPMIAGYEPLVKSYTIAAILSVTPRYFAILAEQGRIPVHRFGRRFVRYRVSDVMRALGVSPQGG
jgi:hypothetical protein